MSLLCLSLYPVSENLVVSLAPNLLISRGPNLTKTHLAFLVRSPLILGGL